MSDDRPPLPGLDDDDALMRLVTEAIDTAEPLDPTFARRAADDAYSLGHLDVLLMELVHDSALEATGVRSGGDERVVAFRSVDLAIDVEVVDGHCRGTIDPPHGAWTLTTNDGTASFAPGPDGYIDLPIDGSRFRFEVTLASGARATTPWVFI